MMKRNMLKMFLFALAATGLFAAVFAGANEAMLYGEVGKVSELPADGTAELIPLAMSSETAPFNSGDYEVWDRTKDSTPTPPEGSVTAQEAADIAADYLWRMFGYDPAGKAFSVGYNAPLPGLEGRTRLDVYVLDNSDNLHGNGGGELEMNCSVDALTGEVLSAGKSLPPAEEQFPFDHDGVVKQLWESNRGEYLSTADAFAKKHFQSENVSAEIIEFSAQTMLRERQEESERNEDGPPFVDYILYNILVKDAYGRGIVVSVAANPEDANEVEGFIQESWIDPYNSELAAEELEELGIN